MAFIGVVGAADERAGFDVGEPELGTDGFERGEFLRRDVAHDGEMFGGRAEVLAEGDDVDVVGFEVAQDLDDFVFGFAEAEHKAGFSGDIGVELFGVGEHVEGPLVACAEADLAVEAGDGFGVVVEHIGGGIDDDFHGVVGALEIGDEDFDFAAGDAFADGLDAEGEEECAAVFAVVAIDAGDDGVLEAEGSDGFGDAAGLIEIDGEGGSFLNGAETAAAGADVAEDHEGGGAVVPAFADVGAGGGFANGVELEAVD